MLGIGEFDNKILIQKRSILQDDMGGALYDWQDGGVLWANIEWKEGKSLLAQDNLESKITIEFTVNLLESLAKKIDANSYRVVYPTQNNQVSVDSNYYTVTGIHNKGGRLKYKTLICDLATNNTATI